MKQATETATFLANSTVSISGESHSMIVEIGHEYKLHQRMYRGAIAAGMTPMTPLEEDVPGEDVEQVEAPQLTTDDKLEILVKACEELILEGSAKNFTQLLKPKVAVVLSMVNFDFTKQLMLRAYDEAIFRTEKNDNDSTEHNRQTE
jgi:hypothetical protein